MLNSIKEKYMKIDVANNVIAFINKKVMWE